MLRLILLTFSLWSLPLLAVAETVYVNDTLRVGVRAEPSNTIAPHGVVITGMQLEVLEHSDGYIKIHSENGVEGWIKEIYVTATKPAKLELAQLKVEYAKLQAQLAKQEALVKATDASSDSLADELQNLKDLNIELRTRLAQANTGRHYNSTTLYIIYSAALVLLGAGGFVAGIMWYRKRAMKRLGGLRV
jgi:SH3 domain protein